MIRISMLLTLLGCRSDSEKSIVQSIDTGTVAPIDADGDGYLSDEDCDDTNATVNPSASEVCDGIDNDCNGDVDDGVTEQFYQDADNDGYGNPEASIEACESPDGYVPFSSDCDDGDASVFPGAEEECDGIDNDCSGEIDEDVGEVYFVDRDQDGFGDDASTVLMCELSVGYAEVGGDCDDLNSTVSPDAIEECDGIDNDCDESVDEDVTSVYYADQDMDGYGDPSVEVESCSRPPGTVENADDCDDEDGTISPSDTESCDGVDNNCDGQIDEEGALGSSMWFFDDDLDGYGAGVGVLACSAPSDYVANNLDCNDNDSSISPTATEVCDGGVDNNCNGLSDDQDGGVSNGTTWYLDYDQDGFGGTQYTLTSCLAPTGYVADSSDCDDTNPSVNTTALEMCDGVDNDCDGMADDDDSAVIYQPSDVVYADLDGDGYGDAGNIDLACSPSTNQVLNADDCDDTDQYVNPLAMDVCDGVDNNCNGQTDEGNSLGPFYTDADGDGFGDPSTMYTGCPVSNSVSNGEDCDDDDGSIRLCEDCAMILDNGLSIGDGIYEIDPEQLNDPFEVYCDMTTEGGGWTLAGRQVPSEQFTLTDQDINLSGGLDPDNTFRYGNDKIQRFAPNVAWRIVSTSVNETIQDYTWFKPACVINWLNLIGSYGSTYIPLDTDCGIAYTNATFSQPISSYTQANCSYGIGQNNSGQYCSIRMSSCAWSNVQEGGAAPCSVSQVANYTISLWMK